MDTIMKKRDVRAGYWERESVVKTKREKSKKKRRVPYENKRNIKKKVLICSFAQIFCQYIINCFTSP